MNNNYLQCIEHQKIFKDEKISEKAYNELFKYAMTENGQVVLKPFNGYLKAQNYVGIIQTQSGFVLEILPKIHEEETGIDNSKNLYIDMLKTIRRLPGYKNIDFANLKKSKMPLFEIFISMFIEELIVLIKKGIKSDYISLQENNSFMKGKLVVGEHVKRNIVHRERFYIEYDQYLPDIPQNRIIKSAIIFLMNKSSELENKRKLKELAFIFDEIPESMNYKTDFERSAFNRTNNYYEIILHWSMVFLMNSSFSTFSGSSIAWALLFPMEKIFEMYLYEILRKEKCLRVNDIEIISNIKNLNYQSPQMFMLNDEFGKQKFLIKPDITCRSVNTFYIIDAKWKILNIDNADGKNGISQSDLYQLLSYSQILKQNKSCEKCNSIELIIVYPSNTNFKEVISYSYNTEEKISLKIVPLKLPGMDS